MLNILAAIVKLLFSRLTRRQALTSVAVAAATTHGGAEQVGAPTLVPLRKNSAKELLLKIALIRDNLFAVWSTALTRGSVRLACYDLNGNQKWSEDLGPVLLFDVVSSGDVEVTVAVIDRVASTLTFTKYNDVGRLNPKDGLPLGDGAVLAVAANATSICALDFATAVRIKRFGMPEAPGQMSPAFDTPMIGGLKPRGIVASMHFVGPQLVLLDHVKARTVLISPNGERRGGRVIHPQIDAAIQRQDNDVAARAALLRASGNEHTITFPTSISFAASDGVNGIWLASSLGPRTIPLFRLDLAGDVKVTYDVQVPDNPITKDRPPLMLAASPSNIALGFREGAVALVRSSEASL